MCSDLVAYVRERTTTFVLSLSAMALSARTYSFSTGSRQRQHCQHGIRIAGGWKGTVVAGHVEDLHHLEEGDGTKQS
eukprot:4476940-Amphidinium_carterae.1